MRIAAIDFARRIMRQISAERAIFAAVRETPARGAVNARHLFDNPDKRHRVAFLAAQGTRNPQAEKSGPSHGLDQRQRQPPRPLALLRGCPDLRRERSGGSDERGWSDIGHKALLLIPGAFLV